MKVDGTMWEKAEECDWLPIVFSLVSVYVTLDSSCSCAKRQRLGHNRSSLLIFCSHTSAARFEYAWKEYHTFSNGIISICAEVNRPSRPLEL